MASKKNEYKHKLVLKKDSTVNKKLQKRRKIVDEMNEDRPVAVYNEIDGENSRNGEISPNISKEYKAKILNIVSWLDSRKETDKGFLKNLSEIRSDLDSDHSILQSNLKKLEVAATQSINELQQATSAVQNIITSLTEIEHTFKKESNAEETKYQLQTEKLQIKEDYDQEIKMLKEKLVSLTKKHDLERLERYYIQEMEINKY